MIPIAHMVSCHSIVHQHNDLIEPTLWTPGSVRISAMTSENKFLSVSNERESYEPRPHAVLLQGKRGQKIMMGWCHMSVGTGGSPKNWSVWWCKCNKTPLFTVFSAHTQIAFMLMLREHMPCLFATRGRFFMTFLDTFSSQHIETA